MQQVVGFIGLGNMGSPVAGHIQRAGFPMVVYDLREEAVRPFLERGARLASSPAEVARLSDVVMTALPTPADVEKVALGPGGVLEGIKPEGVYIDISTNRPALLQRVALAFKGKGAHVLDAPVSGGQPGAPNGIHEVMVGGDRAVYERVKPVLLAFADQLIYAGPIGSGMVCKVIHQMIGCVASQAVAEGLTLGVKAGLDVEVIWEAVRRGLTGRMHVLHIQVPQNVFQDQYEPALFTLALLRKDLGLAIELGRELSVPMPVSNLVEQVYASALNRGWGRRSGYTAIFPLQEEAAGVPLRAPHIDPAKAARYITTRPGRKEVPVGRRRRSRKPTPQPKSQPVLQ